MTDKITSLQYFNNSIRKQKKSIKTPVNRESISLSKKMLKLNLLTESKIDRGNKHIISKHSLLRNQIKIKRINNDYSINTK